MHKLLRRQIQRHFGNTEDLPKELAALLAAVSEAYTASDDDRQLLERSMDLASDELHQANRRLHNDLEERLLTETTLRQTQAQLRLMNRIAGQIMEGCPADEVTTDSVARLQANLPEFRVRYATIDHQGHLHVRASAEPAGVPTSKGRSFDLALAPLYLAKLRARRPVVAGRFTDPTSTPSIATLLGTGALAALEVPLHFSGNVVGVLWLEASETHAWSAAEIATVCEIADSFSMLLRDAQARRDRRNTLESLRERTAELQGIFEAFPDSYARLSTDGKFTSFRRPRDREFVLPANEVVGRHLRQLLPPEAAARWEEAMLVAEASGTPTVVEFTISSPSGEQHREARIMRFMRDEFIAIIRSTTQRKELQARLHLADRMASMGTLAAGVAHEINNPLSFMLSNLDWIGEELDELFADRRSAPQVLAVYEAIEETLAGAHRVRVIARDLKTFSRADDEVVGPVDLHAVLDSSINMAMNEIRHRATLVREYGDVSFAEANHGRLGQVFLNLLMNAAQAIKEGDALANEIRVCTRMDGPSRVVIEVRDTGSGIPQEILGRIFDPFFTTKGVGVGTGLGLSICHGIVRSLHGELIVQSEPGLGSVFRVVLPAATADVQAKLSTPAQQPATRRGRVLIVDDDVMVAASLRRCLERDHDVLVAAHAREAFARILQGERFDVIFCDLMMPDMTGMDLHAAIAEKVPAQAKRMVFITGGAFTTGARTFLERVENAHFGKPLEMAKVRAIVVRSLT